MEKWKASKWQEGDSSSTPKSTIPERGVSGETSGGEASCETGRDCHQKEGCQEQKELHAEAAGTPSPSGTKLSKSAFEDYSKKRSDLEKVLYQHGADSQVGQSAFNNLQKLNSEFEKNFQ